MRPNNRLYINTVQYNRVTEDEPFSIPFPGTHIPQQTLFLDPIIR